MLSKKAFTNCRHLELDSGSSRLIKQGFTLVELLVVVLIISILTAVAVPQYKKAVTKTKLTRAFPAIQAIRQAQELYALEHGDYASSLNKLAVDVALPPEMKVNEPFLHVGLLRIHWCPLEDLQSCNMYQKRLATFDIVFEQEALIPQALGSPAGYKSCLYYASRSNKILCDVFCEEMGGCNKVSWGG